MIPAAAVYLPPFLERLRQYGEPVIFTGEGINSYADSLVAALGDKACPAPGPLRINRAALVAMRGRLHLEKHPEPGYRELLPLYLRRPEAERRLEETNSK